ncbi:MAG TPA: aldolase catalytic domain-containing protein [Fibrobacteraceae bacterium]|jgi:4-hydroxy 2-oxovalerate aldolase|nr:aldolase catalytic domain-containing protein [Fibrobacteraceae bacterium]
MYYETIKVLDCTIRDGGLVNKHNFSLEFVRRLYQLLSAAGIDYMEVGYKNSPDLFDPKEYGPWKFCSDDLLWKLKDGIESKMKLAVMADVGRVNLDAIKPASESPYDMVRVASYVKNIDKGIDLVNTFADLGYETTLNIMAVSRDRGPELDEALDQVEQECKANVLYLVDTFGYFYQEDIDQCVDRYLKHIKTKELGFHGHNNQQLAFSNTIQAIIKRVNYLDCTVSGIGRGAGNCTTELLLGFLKNPKYDIRPVLDAIQELFVPLKDKFEWGYIIPQMICGALNIHPEEAIKIRKTEEKDAYRKFYERMINAGMD